MESTVKLELLKRHNKMNPGDTIEVRPGDARVLKAVGIAKDFVEPTPVVRVMQPEPTIMQSQSVPVPETNEAGAAEFGRQPYNRRDMKPEE